MSNMTIINPSSTADKAVEQTAVTADKEKVKTEIDEQKAIGGQKAKAFLKKAGQKLAQPVVDQFHKDYGEEAVATPKTVGDFILDHGVKLAVAGITIGVTYAAARGKFNGFTKNFTENLKTSGPINAAREAIKSVKLNNAKATLNAEAIKNGSKTAESLATTLNGLADEVATGAKEAAGAASETVKKKGIIPSIKRIFTSSPKEGFAEGSKIPEFIDKVSGKNAGKVKEAVLKAGIAEGADIVDAGLAVGATAVATKGTGIVTKGIVDENDKKLGIESKLDTISKGLDLLEQITG